MHTPLWSISFELSGAAERAYFSHRAQTARSPATHSVHPATNSGQATSADHGRMFQRALRLRSASRSRDCRSTHFSLRHNGCRSRSQYTMDPTISYLKPTQLSKGGSRNADTLSADRHGSPTLLILRKRRVLQTGARKCSGLWRNSEPEWSGDGFFPSSSPNSMRGPNFDRAIDFSPSIWPFLARFRGVCKAGRTCTAP